MEAIMARHRRANHKLEEEEETENEPVLELRQTPGRGRARGR